MIRLDDLIVIQDLFRVRLPEEYRNFLLAYPQRLANLQRKMGAMNESPAARELLNDPWLLTKVNHLVRIPNTPWTRDGGPWPEKFFVVGDDACGDYWAVDVTQPGSAVYFYDHDKSDFEKEFDSAHAFAEWLIADVEDWNQSR